MAHRGLITTFIAITDVAAYRIVSHGAADNSCTLLTDGATMPIGVNGELAVSTGDSADIVRDGLPLVEFGGTVAKGDPLVAGADGKAVKAVPAADTTVFIVGYAEVAGEDGEIGEVFVNPGPYRG